MKIKNKNYSIGVILTVLIVLCDIYMITIKLHYGMYFDESFLIAQAECFTRSIEFFRDSWSSFQFAGVIIAPLSLVYRLFIGSNDGIIYFFRIIWLIMQNILAFASYRVLIKAEIPNGDNKDIKIPDSVAACISACLYFYFAYFYSVNYKTLAFWGCSFIVLLLADNYRKPTVFKAIVLGVVLSFATLSYESMAMMLFPILLCLCFISKVKKIKAGKYCITIVLTCAVCAGIFIGYAVFQIGLNDFLHYFSKFLGYEGYEQNIFVKLGKHVIYYIAAFIANFGIVTFYEKLIKEKIALSKFLFGYLLFLIAVIMFAKPQTITISRVHYVMCIIYTLCMVLIFRYTSGVQKKYYIYLYIIPTGFYVLSIAVATYQGIAVSSMGCILAVIPLFLISSPGQMNMKGVIAVITAMMVAVGLLVVPCIYTTNLTVFHYTEEITDGPAKGTRPLDFYVNKDIYEWQAMVDKYVLDTDKPLMLGNEYYSVGYLYCNASKYGTYSPGYVFLDSDRLVDFWNTNIDRRPTVAIIKTVDLPCDFNEFLSDYPIGIFLDEYFDSWNYDGEYAIARIMN